MNQTQNEQRLKSIKLKYSQPRPQRSPLRTLPKLSQPSSLQPTLHAPQTDPQITQLKQKLKDYQSIDKNNLQLRSPVKTKASPVSSNENYRSLSRLGSGDDSVVEGSRGQVGGQLSSLRTIEAVENILITIKKALRTGS